MHELTASGAARSQAYGKRCCWAATCNRCNCHVLTDKAAWPLARALARKWRFDREYFDLETFNFIRRGLPQVKWTAVVVWICKEQDAKSF